jgi:hypothetical protein
MGRDRAVAMRYCGARWQPECSGRGGPKLAVTVTAGARHWHGHESRSPGARRRLRLGVTVTVTRRTAGRRRGSAGSAGVRLPVYHPSHPSLTQAEPECPAVTPVTSLRHSLSISPAGRGFAAGPRAESSD